MHNAAIEVHRTLGGPGLLESVYEEALVLTYFRLMDLELALVVNFGMRLVKDGINRVANGL